MGKSKAPKKPKEDGTHFPLWYAFLAFLDYDKYGNYPRPGGLDAQDEALINHDFNIIAAEINYWLHVYGAPKNKSKWDKPEEE